jgi:nitrate/nitrite transport system permease protein
MTLMITPVWLRASGVFLLILIVALGAWQIATAKADSGPVDPQMAGLVMQSGFPTPAQVGVTAWATITDPFYDNGPNDKGIGIQLAYSLARVLTGFAIACAVALPLGFLIGLSPLMHRALDPFIQVLRPISPLAWMPIALYTIKDSSLSAIFVIAICAVWPLLINTAHGVASIKREWLNVARTLEVSWFRRTFLVILPAAAPTIVTGMRISLGIAWLVIVAAEMLVGGTGIGYFIWNSWNNLALDMVIVGVLSIGVIGMVLDLGMAGVLKLATYRE